MTEPMKEAPRAGSAIHIQRPGLGKALRAAGFATIAFGLVASIIAFPLTADDPSAYVETLPALLRAFAGPDGMPLAIMAPLGVLIAACGYALTRYAKRHLVRTYKVGDISNLRDSILYLRPFAADENKIWGRPLMGGGPLSKRMSAWSQLDLKGITRYEELLAHAFRHVAPVVTIGSPLEKLPALGAERVYADNDTWKAEVERRSANAKLILHHIGTTEGVHWEIGHIVATCDPLRTVICIGPVDKMTLAERLSQRRRRDKLQETWREFRATCPASFPHGLPETIGDALFIRFDKDWNALPVQPPQQQIGWVWPLQQPDFSCKTIDSTLLWLSWLLCPPPERHALARKGFGCLMMIVYITAFTLLMRYLRS